MPWYRLALLALTVATTSCDSDLVDPPSPQFLDGANGNRQIGTVVSSLGRSVRLFQLGNPSERRDIALGTSSAITPTGLSVLGRYAVVPLGNAASVAVIDMANAAVSRVLTFPSGNATGSAFINASEALTANSTTNAVGRFALGQGASQITDVVTVAPVPTVIVMAGGRAMVVSSNLDATFTPIGDGIVTAINPQTMAVLGTVATGGQNATAAALGTDGLLYVVNTGDYFNPSSLAIINPQTMQRVAVIPDIGVGIGSISFDSFGNAYMSAFFLGTVVWNSATRAFVRGPDNPVCARLAAGGCRGAFDARVDANNRLYQLFFGSPGENLPPRIFVYDAPGYVLRDSIEASPGPSAIDIRTF